MVMVHVKMFFTAWIYLIIRFKIVLFIFVQTLNSLTREITGNIMFIDIDIVEAHLCILYTKYMNI